MNVGPGTMSWIRSAPSMIAAVTSPGMPSDISGVSAPPSTALFEVSGAITPSGLPVPKVSGSFEAFGTGNPEGVIAPETSNNAVEGGALTPLMALGIPGDVTAAIMLGALLIHDVVPSPSFITEEPVLAYSIFIAFFCANFIMLFMQSVMLRVFVLVTRIRMYMLAAVILAFASIGVFALNNVTFDVWTLFWFGVLGFAMRQLGFPLAPMILGVVLGNIAELNLSRALAISPELSPFFTRPWALFFLIVAVFSAAFPWFQRARAEGRAWTGFYAPALLIGVSVPLAMMGGQVRPVLAALAVLVGLLIGYRGVRRLRAA